MKLHLPKALFAAVMAACLVPSTWAGWGTYQSKMWYYLAPGQTGAEITKAGGAESWTEYGIVPENNMQETTIKSFTMAEGDILSICQNPWNANSNYRDFKLLTIENLIVENGGNATLKTGVNNGATINTVTGAVAVDNKGTLTIGTTGGTTTFSGTITNTGTMSVHGAVAVTNLSAFTVQTAGTVSWSDSTNNQGFQISEGSTYILSSGGVTYDSPDGLQVNDNGTMRDVTITDGTATFQGGSVTGTTYYVTNADVTAGAAGTAGATAYDVASGRTLAINSSAADGVALNLQSGSTVSISNASREFTSSSLAYNVEIGDGGVVTVSGYSGWGDAYIRGQVDVNAGGTLKLNGGDSSGWGQHMSAINLLGTADKLATVELKSRQTLMTDINMKGNALMSNIGDGALEFFGGKITAEGTNNVIAGNLMARGANNTDDSYIEVKANGELKITGDLTCNTGQYGTPGSIYKQGEGKLILAGNNTVYNGFNVNAGTVELVKGMTLGTATSTGSLTVDAGAALDIGGTIYGNTGSVTINGALDIASNGDYKLYEAAAEGTYSHGANGYYTSSGSKFYAIQGTGEITIADSATITYDENSTTLTKVDDGYVFTSGEYTDKSTFYINEGKVTANTEGYTDIYEADTYRIAAGTELDVNGQYFAGASFILAEGAKLSNTGGGLNGNNKMFQSIELSGDATVHAHANMGLLAFNSSDAAAATSTLKLNGHTLTKTGDATFFLTGTTVEGNGTIKIQEGTLQVGIEVNHANTADTDASGVDFELDGGTLMIKESGNELRAKSLSGTGTVSGSGRLFLNNTGEAASYTINGNIHLYSLQITGKDSYTIAGNMTLEGTGDNSDDNKAGYLLMNAGNLTLQKGTYQVKRLDLSQGGNSSSQLILESGANMTASDHLWLGKNAGIEVKNGATFSKGLVKVEAKTTDRSAKVTFHANSGDEFTIGNANYKFADAKVSVNASADGSTLKSKLENSVLVNSGSGTLTADHSGNVFSGIDATLANITVLNSTEQMLNTLVIGAGKNVSVYSGNAAEAAAATVTTSSLSAGAGATLNAHLILTDGATLTFDGALAMGGSTLTLGTGLTLNPETLAAIKNLSGDERYELFTGVGALTLGGNPYAMGTDVLDATSGIDLSKYFTLADAQTPAVLSDEQLSSGYYLGFDANGTLYAGVIPEPTTATLSLLALAALAARRRRK